MQLDSSFSHNTELLASIDWIPLEILCTDAIDGVRETPSKRRAKKE